MTPGGLPAEERADYESRGFHCLGDMSCALESLAVLLAPSSGEPVALAAPAAVSDNGLLSLPRPLTEPESLGLLRRFGIPVVETIQCASIDEAAAAAERLGYPVVLKAVVPGVAHKSDAGLVRVGIRDANALRQGYREFGAPAGLAVQPMIGGKLEAIAGLTRTPDIGLFMMAGLGGIHAEALDNVSMWPVPVGRAQIEATLAGTPLGRIFASSRWTERGSLDALVDTLVKLQAFAVWAGERIEAVDINPLIIGAHGCIAVDALIVPRKGDKS
jgi:succinyl-CoA synthetase beta subunit